MKLQLVARGTPSFMLGDVKRTWGDGLMALLANQFAVFAKLFRRCRLQPTIARGLT